jgi:hypothetical protein
MKKLISATCSHDNLALFGSWIDDLSGDRIDILDGFKAGVGPILIIEGD